jgi:hydroxyethylthiazole kinase-like uncharacterized protein yjeF
MHVVNRSDLVNLFRPSAHSHKGQNGRMLLIGGSHLFHAASLWALTVSSRIVDLVHYASISENNDIVRQAKEEFRNGIVVPRNEIDAYIQEDDCILIGPGMTRDTETKDLTDGLLKKYSEKQWVIDAGALQMMDLNWIPKNSILTPHHQEFQSLWERFELADASYMMPISAYEREWSDEEKVKFFAKTFHCIIVMKGLKDIVSNGEDICVIEGGNAGMTKGGTGDVLAGLIAALACKNDPLLATIAGSFINKQAGDVLYESVGPYFNATDLANQIPKTMKELLG